VAQLVVRDGARQLFDEERPLGARADEAHVTHEHVEHLRQLVDAGLAEVLPDPGHALVVRLRPDRSRVLLRVDRHRAELQDREHLAVLADALLTEEHGARARRLDQDRGDEGERRRQDEPEDRGADVDDALRGRLNRILGESRPKIR
jgi:hypothetical protein